MGVPAFFRWLCNRNPHFVIDATSFSPDEESENPEIDNLYLDMNGIIHPCCHSDSLGVPLPTTIFEMFNTVFLYMDLLMNIVRPKKVLYLAIDGVAPRAKMNQQRGRRFRSVQEQKESFARKMKLMENWRTQGILTDEIKEYVINKKPFDKNVITPGTEFMQDLADALEYYIQLRVSCHPQWQHLTVFFSNSNIPGEGEHKILEFIRLQRAQDDFNPNTRHCIYGADADLIMLGLSTHEPHFYIIRETILAPDDKQCTICGKTGHFFIDCKDSKAKNQPEPEATVGETDFDNQINKLKVKFQFARISVLRQYLDYEFRNLSLGFDYDLERIIDDFVFMCFFVGNDFIPHLPTFSIREGGVDSLLFLYKKSLPEMGGYISEQGGLNLARLKLFLQKISSVEECFIEDMLRREDYQRQKDLNFQKDKKYQERFQDANAEKVLSVAKFKDDLKEISKQQNETTLDVRYESANKKNVFFSFQEKFYSERFSVSPRDFLEFKEAVQRSYIEALVWNFSYYYKGCVSWSWFYPYHYSPFVSDLTSSHQVSIDFELGVPFTPFQQLMSVIPPDSADAIPEIFRPLMLEHGSQIADFYPSDFYVDLKGKRFAWLGEVILPFIDQERLLQCVQPLESQVNEKEKERNQRGKQLMFVGQSSNQKLFQLIKSLNGEETQGLAYKEYEVEGSCEKMAFKQSKKPFESLSLAEFYDGNLFAVCYYTNCDYKEHKTTLKAGVVMPENIIDDEFMSNVNKKLFGGERIIRMLERALGSAELYNNSLLKKAEQHYQQSEGQSRGNQHNNNYRKRHFEKPPRDSSEERRQNKHYDRKHYPQHSRSSEDYRSSNHGHYSNHYQNNYSHQGNQGHRNQGHQGYGNQGRSNHGSQGHQNWNQGHQGHSGHQSGYQQGHHSGNQGYPQGNQGHQQGQHQGHQQNNHQNHSSHRAHHKTQQNFAYTVTQPPQYFQNTNNPAAYQQAYQFPFQQPAQLPNQYFQQTPYSFNQQPTQSQLQVGQFQAQMAQPQFRQGVAQGSYVNFPAGAGQQGFRNSSNQYQNYNRRDYQK